MIIMNDGPKNKLKIAHIICAFPPYKGGIGQSAYEFNKVLSKHGHRIKTFSPYYPQEKSNDGNNIRLKPWLRYGKGAFTPQLFFRLKKFDLIFFHYPFFGTTEIIWLYKLIFRQKKLIIHYHMDVINFNLITKILSLPAKLIRYSLFKKANIITCASLDYIKHSDIAKIYKKYPKKFKEIPFGVDTNKFTPAPKKNSQIKNILFVGGLDKAHYFKGLDILFKALSNLKNINWQLSIVGDGDLKPQYEKQTKELDITNKVNFWGKDSNEKLPEIYRQADLFVLPSINKNEAFGLVLLEAMASGVPVIASALPGVRTVFQDNIQGLLAKPGDSDDLKNKIEKILNNDEKRKQMGLKARKLVLEKYSWEEVGKKLNNIIK